ncbi:hypothetical protein MMC31_007999 [Peltigera leucophlebia]|nr:hypothetical protein [Peltigera leucophlebia]
MAPGLRSKLDPKSTAQQVITSSIDGNESFLDANNGFEMVNTNDLGPKESKGPILGSNSTTAETGVNRPDGKGRVPVASYYPSVDTNDSFLDANDGFEMVNAKDLDPIKSQSPILGSNSRSTTTGVNSANGKKGAPVDPEVRSGLGPSQTSSAREDNVVHGVGKEHLPITTGIETDLSSALVSDPSEEGLVQSPRRPLKQPQSWLDDLLPAEKWIDAIQAFSNFLQNFDWSRTFWKATNGSQSMHVLCSQGRDGSRGIAQIWVLGVIEFTALVISKFPMFTVKICITNNDRTRLKTGLTKNGNLGDTWSMISIEPVISVSAKPDFVESMINIMQDDSNKAAVMTILEDKTFPFAYDVRNTPPADDERSGVTDPTEIPHQGGIKAHMNDLVGGKTWIMHPKRQRHRADGSWLFENGPNYTAKLPKIKSRLKKIEGLAKIIPDYLYEPDRTHE